MATLHSWVLRRVLPIKAGPGTGKRRMWSGEEVFLVAIAFELTKLGLPMQTIAGVVSKGKSGSWEFLDDVPGRYVLSQSTEFCQVTLDVFPLILKTLRRLRDVSARV